MGTPKIVDPRGSQGPSRAAYRSSPSLVKVANHLAAHVQERLACADHDAVIMLRRFATTYAIEAFGVDEKAAVAWLERAGFGDITLNGLATYYRKKLDQVRRQAAAASQGGK